MSKPLIVVIVEDEPATARSLSGMLKKLDDTISVTVTLSGVEDSVEWFENPENHYDLVFMDIRLSDGLSFEIFKRAKVTKPVIFVTAYNDYAIPAFKNNGIDYILKPFDESEVEQALTKFNSLVLRNEKEEEISKLEQLIEQMVAGKRQHKRSFLVHFRDKLIPVETSDIAWFYTANEIVYAQTTDNRQYVVDFTMEQLEQQVDNSQFYRANRQFIVNRKCITEVAFYFNGRLMVKIKPEPPEHIVVSKARVPEFKNWMNR